MPRRDLAHQVALVTGAGRGIGAAIARALAAEGMRLVLAARAAAEIEALRDRLIAAAPDARPSAAVAAPTDVADEAAVRRLLAETRRVYGRLDALINNAGVAARKPLVDTTAAEWDRAMAVNARGPFLLCREAIPLLRDTRGAIVNIASVVAVKGYANQAAYSASKHALLGMTKALAQELQADGIRVHAVCPGGVATPMIREMRPDLDPAVLIAPEEIAEIVVFLLRCRGNAMIDQVNVRRAAGEPWFA